MKVLTVGQHKGGVGKTTISRLVAIAAARAGQRVLAVDLDAQCSLSQRFIKMRRDPGAHDASFYPPVHPEYDPADDDSWSGVSSSADPYFGNAVVPYPTAVPNVDILPGHSAHLRRVNNVEEDAVTERVVRRMREFLSDPGVAELYDLVVIDTPPSQDSALAESAMYASTHVLIPAKMEPQCVEGLQGMLSLFMRVNSGRGIDDRVKLIGILVNMYKRVALHTALLESLKHDPATAPLVLPCMMADRIAIAESDHESIRPDSVLNFPAKDPARREAEAMVRHVLAAMDITVPEIAEQAA